MTPGPCANKFPKSARILKSDDFGSVLRAQGPGSIRLGRLDISLRYRTPLLVQGNVTVAEAKQNVRRSTELVITALFKRLKTIELKDETVQ